MVKSLNHLFLQKLTSIVSKEAVEEMVLKEGDSVSAVIKSTSVMIMK